MGLPLVVGVDGSRSSLRAVDWAVDAAVAHGVPLRLVHAFLWQRYEGAEFARDLGRLSEKAIAEALVDTAVGHARRRAGGLEISASVVPEDPVRTLLDEGRNASMLVLGSRGRGRLAGLLLGSVSLAVAARADCPVVVARGADDGFLEAHPRVAVGVGAAGSGSQAVAFAFREAEVRHWALLAVRAWRCPAHEPMDHPLLTGDPARHHREQAAEILDEALVQAVRDHPRVEVRRQVTEGQAGHVLLEVSRGAALLVVGARRGNGRSGLQLGRVAHTALHHASCPVAVVPLRG
ncbi:universal stress protein [Streptomyces caeni]|uniref:Universal stress protein n=1 Tax=Streptomyces caeni TaxID=2307231 RepID=A0ABW4J2E5_9ACTN